MVSLGTMNEVTRDEQGRPEWDGGDFEEKAAVAAEAAAEVAAEADGWSEAMRVAHGIW